MKAQFLKAGLLTLMLFLSVTIYAQKKIVVLSPQVTVMGNLPRNWTEQQQQELRNFLASNYQAEVVRKLIRQRNRAKYRDLRVQIIALRAGEPVPVGNDVAYVVVPRVNHVIYMSPQAARAYNMTADLINFNSPFWTPYVRPHESYCTVNVNAGNTRNLLVANRYMSYTVASRLFKWLR